MITNNPFLVFALMLCRIKVIFLDIHSVGITTHEQLLSVVNLTRPVTLLIVKTPQRLMSVPTQRVEMKLRHQSISNKSLRLNHKIQVKCFNDVWFYRITPFSLFHTRTTVGS